ncbi:MAG: hypothetical protein ACLUKN_09030 [Bacilli bacterium]
MSEALRSTRGNAAAAARILNLSQRILNYNKELLHQYGVVQKPKINFAMSEK